MKLFGRLLCFLGLHKEIWIRIEPDLAWKKETTPEGMLTAVFLQKMLSELHVFCRRCHRQLY